MSEDANLLKTSRTMAEPGLVDSTSHCTGALCFVSAAVFGCQKYGCVPPLSLLA